MSTPVPAPEPYDPTLYHRIEVTSKVEAEVRGVVLVSSAEVREALSLDPDADLTDEDLADYATEHDNLDGVELEVRDVTSWKSSDAKLLRRATTDPAN